MPGLRALGEWNMDILKGMQVKKHSNRTLVEADRTRASTNVGADVVEGHWASREKVRMHHLYSIIWPIIGLRSLNVGECQVQLCCSLRNSARPKVNRF